MRLSTGWRDLRGRGRKSHDLSTSGSRPGTFLCSRARSVARSRSRAAGTSTVYRAVGPAVTSVVSSLHLLVVTCELITCYGQPKDDGGEDEEHEEEVGEGEPAVPGGDLAQPPGHGHGEPQQRHGVEDEDARDVEHEVNQRDLHRLPLVPGGGQGRQQAGGRRACDEKTM